MADGLHGRPRPSGRPEADLLRPFVGRWEGDTLVVDTVGYNEDFWLDRGGMPTTEQLHTIERFTRTDADTLAYEVTIDDPGAYTKPWTGTFNLRWEEGTELFEYVVPGAELRRHLMVGASVKEGTSTARARSSRNSPPYHPFRGRRS